MRIPGRRRRGSARALPFVMFPLVVLIMDSLLGISAVAQNGTPTGSTSATAEFCAQPNTGCPPPGSPGTTYICTPTQIIGYLQACKILPSCNAPPYPPPAFCIGDAITATGAGCLFQFIAQGSAGCGVYLNAGFSVFVPTTQIATSLTTTGAFFGFSAGGASGFIFMIGVAVGIISLLGLTVFSSGLQGESLHILFQGGIITGLWLIFTGLSGYPNDAMFGGFNQALSGSGTFLYAMMSGSVVLGFVGLVSRGA